MVLAFLATVNVYAQTKINAISDTGKIGIGTLTPISRLQVVDNSRNYYVNRPIIGQTGDSQGANYILLHEIYDSVTGTLLTDRHVMGKITGIRGSTGAYNRKFTIEVNTSSAYNANMGSLISYNEMAGLVTVVFNGKNYLAVEIYNGATLNGFSFTGYATSETLQLVKLNEVSGRKLFTQTNPIGIPGSLSIGIPAGGASLVVAGGPLWTTNNWTKAVKLFSGAAIEFAAATRSFGIGATGNGLYFSNANVDGSGASN